MTLAELYAVIGICAPAQLPRIAPLIALVPLFAQRRGVSMHAVYAMPAAFVFGAMATVFGDFAHNEMMNDAMTALADAEQALSPDRMRERMMRRAG